MRSVQLFFAAAVVVAVAVAVDVAAAVGFVIRMLIAIARALRQLRDHDSQL